MSSAADASSVVGGHAVAGPDRRVLVSGTTLRFGLLALLVATSSVQLLWLAAPQPPVHGVPDARYTCLYAVGENPPWGHFASIRIVTNEARWHAYSACVQQFSTSPWPWVFGGTVLVFAVALLFHWWTPAWKIRRGRLVPVRGGSELAGDLVALTQRAGLVGRVTFVIRPAAVTASGVAFGRWGRSTVCLNAGLVALRQQNPALFRTVVLHELAHVRNRDVDIAYATEALWRAFAVLVLLPYTLLCLVPAELLGNPASAVTLWQQQWDVGVRGLVRPAVLFALVLLARADVLRTRELYADLDAARWGGELPHPGAEGRPARGLPTVLQSAVSLWRTHPSWAQRASALHDPAPLFGAQPVMLFLNALAAMEVVTALYPLSNDTPGPYTWRSAPAWLVAAAITGITGVALWRAVTHAVLTGRPGPSGLVAGCWLGAGLMAGELLTFRSSANGWLPPQPWLLLLLVIAGAVLCWWATRCAELWLVRCRGRSPRWTLLGGLAALLLVFGAWFTLWDRVGSLYLLDLASPGDAARMEQVLGTTPDSLGAGQLQAIFPVLGVALQFVVSAPLTALGGAVLWLYPLLAWARRPVTGVPAWVRSALGGAVGSWRTAPEIPPLRWVLSQGMVGGALAVCSLTALAWWLHPGHPRSGGATWIMVVALLTAFAISTIAALTAALVYRRAPAHRLPVALVAAGITILVGMCGAIVLLGTDGCVRQRSLFVENCGWVTAPLWGLIHSITALVLGIGFYPALFAALAGAGLWQRWLEPWRARRKASERPPTASPHLPNPPAAACHFPTPSPALPPPTRTVGRAAAHLLGSGLLCLLGVLAARGVLHATRPDHLPFPWIQHTQEAVALGLLVTFLLVWWAAARRYRPAAALAVAAGGLLLGLAAAFVLQAADGCSGNPSTLTRTCRWRPGTSWFLTSSVLLPTVAALVTWALALVALLRPCLVWWRQRRTGRQAPYPFPRPLWQHRTVIGVVCAVSLTALGGLPPASDSPASAPVAPPPTLAAVGPRPNDIDVAVWWVNVGSPLTHSLDTSREGVVTSMREFSRRVDSASLKALGRACERWATNALRAQSARPAPNPALANAWRQAARSARDGGTLCRRSIDRLDTDAFDTAMADIVQQLSHTGTFYRLLAPFLRRMTWTSLPGDEHVRKH
ncbi:M48 family metalloprotease [Streptomyces nigrescens]|uniref:M48 family metalloprotease n=1 Tax=Streptomyces nigrescens TaxID=1920 RepID=A0ABY7ITR6_STRNI|nr:M48 family metalloprotease [Streptomyces nigrescens]WAU02065.1 M48 family metalloprotease [Streptomyces nigrescens]